VARFFADLVPCGVGIEACATAHHWCRLIARYGHVVRLIPPSYVKPYVRRSKTDAADAAAICEAVGRPTMRFVPVKSTAQQAALLHHRTHDLLVRQRTMLITWIQQFLNRVENWPRGSAWCRDSIQAAASRGWDGCQSKVTDISVAY